VTLGQFRRLQKLLAIPGFDEESVGSVCPAAVPLAAWCRTVDACLAQTGFRGCAEPGSRAPSEAAGVPGPRRPVGSKGPGPVLEPQEPQPHPEPAEPEQPGPPGAGAPLPSSEPEPGGGRGDGLVVTPDLAALSAEERRRVIDLRVERPGVGSVVFHGATDCAGLGDLAELVRLAPGEVLVYPGGSRPPPGQGLNKRATVTMHRCWPPQGRRRLQDPRSRERYRERIRAMTEERGAAFLDYDCDAGVWQFQVEHF